MNQEELVRILKSIRVWTLEGSIARDKLTELIVKLGGK